jgi:hypothetical protein
MNFIGIDLHTNRFTCCYWSERSSVKEPTKDREIKTFELNEQGMAEFYATLTADTANRRFERAGGGNHNHVLVCPAIQGQGEGSHHRQHLRAETDFGINAAPCPVQHGQDRCGQAVPDS